jgi:hypothetical protein
VHLESAYMQAITASVETRKTSPRKICRRIIF